MPAAHDLDPGVMTEEERLAKRRYQAYFAFTMDHPPVQRDRVLRFQHGVQEQRDETGRT